MSSNVFEIFDRNGSSQKEKSTPNKRGRPPRIDGENKSKRFNLIMKPSTLSKLNKLSAQKQLITGERVSVTGLINEILENYVRGVNEIHDV